MTSKQKKLIRRVTGDALTYLLLVLAVLLVLMPLAWIISTSLKPTTEIFDKPPH